MAAAVFRIMELIFANGKRDFGAKFTAVLNFASHLPKPCTDRFAYEKAKPATVIPQPNF